MEYVVLHSKDIKEIPTPAYPMNARPHGIALVIIFQSGRKLKEVELDAESFISTFNYLQYTVQPYNNNVTSSQMIQLVEEIATKDHTAYDSFVCCISAPGANEHYIRCNDNEYVNVYELVDIVQQCPTLQRKPKLFFFASGRNSTNKAPAASSSFKIGLDTLVVWSTQKNKRNSYYQNFGSKFATSFKKTLQFKSKNSTLLSMMYDLSAFLCMFPPRDFKRAGIKEGQCPEIESQLKGDVLFFHEEEIPGKYNIV